METCIFNILVIHELDSAWLGVKTRLETLLREGFIKPLMIVPVKAGELLVADPKMTVITRTSAGDLLESETTLFGHLAVLGAIPGIRVAAVRCDPAGLETTKQESDELHLALKKIDSSFTQFAFGVQRREIRLSVIGEGEKAPGSPYFSPAATANVVILPRDISMNEAVARPVLRDAVDFFVSHAATEIASVLGMWTSMESAPVDEINIAPMGISGYRLSFATSRVKGLLAPPLPVGDLVDDSGILPLPSGYSPVDNLDVVVERYADVVYPANMVFAPLPQPDDHQYKAFRYLAKAYATEFVNTIKALPSIVRKGFQSEIDTMGANALDRLIGGTDARIRPVVPEDGDEGLGGITEDRIEEIIRDIEYRDGRPVVGGVTTEQWDRLVSNILGIADAAKSTDELREIVMPSSILVRDKGSIAPNVPTVGQVVQAVMPPDVVRAAEATAAVEEQTATVPDGEEGGSEAPTETPVQTFVMPGEVDLMALRDAVRRSGMERPEVVEPSETDISTGDVAISVDRADRTLVGFITAKFDREFRKSEDSTVESLQQLRELPGLFRSREGGKVSASVVIAIAAALGLVIVSLATHGVFRSFWSFDWMSRKNRDFLWLVFSSLLLVISIAALFSGGRRTWQGRTMILAGVCSGILAVEFFAFGPIYEILIETGINRRTAIVGGLVLIGTLVVTWLAITRNIVSSDPIRKRVGRILGIFAWFYVVVGLSAYTAGPVSFINDWEDGTRHRFLIAAQFVGWVCLIIATLVIVSIRVRERNSFGVYTDRFNWAQENLMHSIDARRHLRAAYTQWLLVSASVARIVWYPLGREASERTAFDGLLTGDETILKFDLAQVGLSAQGHVALLARLRQMFVRPGWVRTQFNYARDLYMSEISFITGDPIEQHDPVGCVAVPPINHILDNSAQGDRFEFAKQMYEGRFDSGLLAAATNNNLDVVYANILTDTRMHEVSKAQNEYATGSDFLVDIVPPSKTILPPRLVNILASGGDASTQMTSHLWWPDTSILNRPQFPVDHLHKSEVVTLDKLNDSVVLVSVLVEISEAFKGTDVNVVEDLDPSGNGN